jgi:mannose-6-phosphate isomerase
MSAQRLNSKSVEKPWGRHELWPGFPPVFPDGAPIGEIWFEAPPGANPALMVKYLFTSERLSIQVHPNDDEARARGHASGKDEAWLILAAEPGATIALGTRHPVSQEALRAAALDGSIEQLMDWKPAKAGDVIYSPAKTVHALGAGLTLIEVQQNVDLTYRLYDYGRPRELHLDDGIAVSDPVPFVVPPPLEGERICEGPKLSIDRWQGAQTQILPSGWLIPVTGGGTLDGQRFEAAECWMIEDETIVVLDAGADVLFAQAKG